MRRKETKKGWASVRLYWPSGSVLLLLFSFCLFYLFSISFRIFSHFPVGWSNSLSCIPSRMRNDSDRAHQVVKLPDLAVCCAAGPHCDVISFLSISLLFFTFFVSSPIKTLICVFVFARSHSFFPPTYLIQKRVSLILLSDRRQPDGSDCIFFKIVCIIKIERKVKRNGKNCHQLFKKGSEKRH